MIRQIDLDMPGPYSINDTSLAAVVSRILSDMVEIGRHGGLYHNRIHRWANHWRSNHA